MALFLVLAISPLAVVGYLAYDISRKALEKEIVNHLVSTNLLKISELNRWVTDNKQSIEELAQRPLVRQYATVLASHDASAPDYRQAHDRLVGDHLRPRLKYGRFIELLILCPRHGLVLAADNPLQEGKYRDTAPYFIEGRSRTYLQSVYYSTSLEKPAMTVGTPIKDAQGNLIAVLAGRLDLAELSKIVAQQSGASQTEDTYLVNSFNFFVTEPRFGHDYAMKKFIYTEGVRDALKGQDGVGFYDDYRGEAVIGAYKWLPEYQMCLLTEVDQAEAYQPVMRLRWLVAGAAVMTALVVTLLAFFFAGSITRPVRRLVAGAEELGEGNLNVSVGTTAPDEIGDLSRAFDVMTERLRVTTVSRDELAGHVRDRTAQLEAVNQELEAFAYSVSHDLRAPLRALDGFSAALLSRYQNLLDAQGRHYLARIQAATQRMGALINDMLDLSRVTRREMVRRTVDLSALAQEIAAELLAEDQAREVEFVIAPDLTAQGDGHLLRIALENLLKNAVKFTASRPRTRIEFQMAVPSGECVYSVSDNGVGFDMAYADKLFAPFQRLHAMDEFPGTGIGLVTVKRIITRHGGRIWTEAAPDQGATFYFTLGGES
jgi:signal transduction histidine kinase